MINGTIEWYGWVIIGCIYFLPTIQAWSRKHNNTYAIGMTNAIFGWTVLVWAGCLIWACSDNTRKKSK